MILLHIIIDIQKCNCMWYEKYIFNLIYESKMELKVYYKYFYLQSYTATVLHAAKSLGKGLRELGETVASSLTGNSSFKPGTSPASAQSIGNTIADTLQKGVVTILDIEVHMIFSYHIYTVILT